MNRGLKRASEASLRWKLSGVAGVSPMNRGLKLSNKCYRQSGDSSSCRSFPDE